MHATIPDTLSSLQKGEEAIVVGVWAGTDADGPAICTRLIELGFVRGEKVRVIAQAFPRRDPIAVRIGNTTFALRRREASMVHVGRAASADRVDRTIAK